MLTLVCQKMEYPVIGPLWQGLQNARDPHEEQHIKPPQRVQGQQTSLG
jgi:hypothetical protein